MGSFQSHRGRRHLTIALLAVTALMATACGGTADEEATTTTDEVATTTANQDESSTTVGAEETTTSSAGSGEWTFTDGRGVTVTRESTPTRIVSLSTFATPALLQRGITPIATWGGTTIADTPTLQGLDTTGIEELSTVEGEIDIEKLASLEPDLIVTAYSDPYTHGFVDDAQVDLAEQVAPVVAIDNAQEPTPQIADWNALAEALGTDLSTDEMAAAEARFETALERVRSAASSNPDLVYVAGFFGAETTFMYNPEFWGFIREFEDLGLTFLVPESPREDNVGQDISWEEFNNQFTADVILWDARPWSAVTTPEEWGAPMDIWQTHPAVKANQLGPWYAGWEFSWDNYADILEELAVLVEESEKVTE